MIATAKTKDTMDAQAIRSSAIRDTGRPSAVYEWECYDRFGNLKWTDRNHNVCTDQGLNKFLGIGFYTSSKYASGWFVGLVNGSAVSPATGWTYQGIGSSFTENTTYTASLRQAWTPAAVASKQITNSGSKASFTVSGSSQITVCGAFLCAGANAATKGNNAAGNVMYNISQFSSGAKTLDPADVLKVTITLSLADS